MQRIGAAECPPDKAHVLLWDSERPGLCVRVYPSGRKVFTLLYRAGGGRAARLRWLTVGEVGAVSLADAREAAGVHLGAVAKGRDPAAERREGRRRSRAMLGPAIERYGEDLERRRLVRARETISMLERELLDALGDVDLATLDRAALVERVEAIERAGLRGKAKDFRAKAGTFLNWAASSGLIPRTRWPAGAGRGGPGRSASSGRDGRWTTPSCRRSGAPRRRPRTSCSAPTSGCSSSPASGGRRPPRCAGGTWTSPTRPGPSRPRSRSRAARTGSRCRRRRSPSCGRSRGWPAATSCSPGGAGGR
jgi:hypothetical protein